MHVKQRNLLRRVGLARALSKLGYCSRSNAMKLIRAGRVRLNGAVRRDSETPVHLEKDRIQVDGESLAHEEKIYLMLNKPKGVVTTASDEKGRANVLDYLDRKLPWVSPVGRLDKASEGLLLFTNDSEWAACVLAPGKHLDKTYHVQIARVVDPGLVESVVRGVREADGTFLRAKRASILRCGEKNSWLEIVLDEGKNRQIRRIFQGLGVEVLRLVRVAIGPLTMGELAKGAYRPLTNHEKQALDRAIERRVDHGSARRP
jgi:23S rRNA pseudouridine2605 synthase